MLDILYFVATLETRSLTKPVLAKEYSLRKIIVAPRPASDNRRCNL